MGLAFVFDVFDVDCCHDALVMDLDVLASRITHHVYPVSSSSAVSSVFRVPCSVFRVPCSVFRVPCSVFRVPCSVFRLPPSAFRLPSSVPSSVFRLLSSAPVRSRPGPSSVFSRLPSSVHTQISRSPVGYAWDRTNTFTSPNSMTLYDGAAVTAVTNLTVFRYAWPLSVPAV
jgi:hypothetical protein